MIVYEKLERLTSSIEVKPWNLKGDTFSGFSSSVFVCIFSCIFVFLYFFGICLVLSIFLFRIVTYLKFVIIVSRILLMLYIFQILNGNVFSFFASFLTL